MKKILVLACLGMFLAAGQAMASEPIQLSLTPGIAIHDQNTRITGLSLSIWGENPQSSLALGIVNGFSDTSKGLSLGFFNYSDNYKGVQLGFVNYSEESLLGGQLALANYVEGSVKGLQMAFFNYAGDLTGGQLAWGNWVEGSVKGLQVAFGNYAGSLKGLQLGFVNYADSVEAGVQIGIVNIIPQNQWFSEFPDEIAPGMVLVNWRF
jgi:hypothetical protein